MTADRLEDQREDQVEKDAAVRYESWSIQKLELRFLRIFGMPRTA